MSGTDGWSKGTVAIRLRSCQERIKNRIQGFFSGTYTSSVGIAYTRSGITAVLLRRQETRSEGQMAGHEEVRTRPENSFLVEEIFTGSFPEGAPFDLQLVAERSAQLLANHGLESLPIGIGVPPDQSHQYETRLPAEVPEWQEAVQWEIDEQLQQDGLGIDTCYTASRKSGDIVETVAVPRQYGEELMRQFAQAIKKPTCLTVFYPREPQVAGVQALCGTDSISFSQAEDEPSCRKLLQEAGPSLAAALTVLGYGEALGLAVLVHRPSTQDFFYKRLSILMEALAVLLLFLWGAVDGALLLSAEKQATKAEESMAALSQDAKEMQRYEALQKRIDRKEKLLLKLSESPIPAYGLLVHLGRPEALVEGVWLTEVHIEENGELLLRGNAVTMEALSSFMGALEADTGFFKDTPVLEEATEAAEGQKEKGQGISFRIRTNCR